MMALPGQPVQEPLDLQVLLVLTVQTELLDQQELTVQWDRQDQPVQEPLDPRVQMERTEQMEQLDLQALTEQ